MLPKHPIFFYVGDNANLRPPIRLEKIHGGGIPSLSRSLDLLTDPGLKSHLITFPCLEITAASTSMFI
jgi:hypothetical protein